MKVKGSVKGFSAAKNFFRWINTVRFLSPEQIFYRLWVPIKRRLWRNNKQLSAQAANAARNFQTPNSPKFSINCGLVDEQTNTFTFLNKSKSFKGKIDWGFAEYGLLWQFNLHYFDWLSDDTISESFCADSMLQFIDFENETIKRRFSFPIAYRLRNWIKFIGRVALPPEQYSKICAFIWQDARQLAAFPEREIGGNHLLECGLALFWPSVLFGDEQLYRQAASIVKRELQKQILPTGAHYELSPAYHTFIQKNILETFLLLNGKNKADNISSELLNIFFAMLSHQKLLETSDGFVPQFGDSNEENYIKSKEFEIPAQYLNYQHSSSLNTVLDFGLIIKKKLAYDFYFKTGEVLASEQPGHAHADALSFCLFVNGNLFIVDPGVSTYEEGEQREKERSTAGHNTVCINGRNSADVWKAFRMAGRIKSVCLANSYKKLTYQHTGYFIQYGLSHRRSVLLHENSLEITDELVGDLAKCRSAVWRLHFYPGLSIKKLSENSILVKNDKERIQITAEGVDWIIDKYLYAKGFNRLVSAECVRATMKTARSHISIKIENEQID